MFKLAVTEIKNKAGVEEVYNNKVVTFATEEEMAAFRGGLKFGPKVMGWNDVYMPQTYTLEEAEQLLTEKRGDAVAEDFLKEMIKDLQGNE